MKISFILISLLGWTTAYGSTTCNPSELKQAAYSQLVRNIKSTQDSHRLDPDFGPNVNLTLEDLRFGIEGGMPNNQIKIYARYIVRYSGANKFSLNGPYYYSTGYRPVDQSQSCGDLNSVAVITMPYGPH